MTKIGRFKQRVIRNMVKHVHKMFQMLRENNPEEKDAVLFAEIQWRFIIGKITSKDGTLMRDDSLGSSFLDYESISDLCESLASSLIIADPRERLEKTLDGEFNDKIESIINKQLEELGYAIWNSNSIVYFDSNVCPPDVKRVAV